MSESEALQAIRSNLERGELEPAARALTELDTTETRDAGVHLAAARAAEELGQLDRALREYNLALRDQADCAAALERLTELRLDLGQPERAVRALARLLTLRPDDSTLRLRLVELYDDLGRGDDARRVALEGLGGGSDGAAAGLRRASSPEPEVRALDADSDPEASVWRESDLLVFLQRFGGREGVHARQWASPTGRHGYTPVPEPLTLGVVRAHVQGSYTVGVYPVRMDNTVRFLAFDLDVARFALARADRSPRGLEGLLDRALGYARRLIDACAAQGIACLLERSGYKGWHVWVFFDPPTPAAGARRLGAALLAAAGQPPAEVSVELFPKQSRVPRDGLGNLIKLPLGVHRVTGCASELCDLAQGRPLTEPFEALRQVAPLGRETLAGLLGRLGPQGTPSADEPGPDGDRAGAVVAFPHPAPARRSAAQRVGSWPSEAEAAPLEAPLAPDELGYTIEDDLDLQWMAARCAVLAELLRRAQQQRSLSHDERLVLTYTVGHLRQGPQAVNAVLSETLNSEPSSYLKSRLRGNPMSCPKIRQRLPDLASTVGCDCAFDPRAGAYPTPLLHLQTLRPAARAAADAVRMSEVRVERLVAELMHLRAEVLRAQRRSHALEQELGALLDDQSLTSLATPMGVLRRTEDGRLSLGLEDDRGHAAPSPARDGAGAAPLPSAGPPAAGDSGQ